MRTDEIPHLGALFTAATLAAFLAPAQAAGTTHMATQIWVPAGTKVPLAFVTPVDSGKITSGTRVHFKVAANVLGGRHVILRAGTPASGTVTQVTKPGAFGASSKVVIGVIRTTAVDGGPVALKDVIVSKATVSNSRAGAAGTSVAGAIVLGPVGLLAGALVKGSYVSVPRGTVVVDTTTNGVNVFAP